MTMLLQQLGEGRRRLLLDACSRQWRGQRRTRKPQYTRRLYFGAHPERHCPWGAEEKCVQLSSQLTVLTLGPKLTP